MDTALQPSIGSSLIQHATPASELFHPFFPTFMGPTKLGAFIDSPSRNTLMARWQKRHHNQSAPLEKSLLGKQRCESGKKKLLGEERFSSCAHLRISQAWMATSFLPSTQRSSLPS